MRPNLIELLDVVFEYDDGKNYHKSLIDGLLAIKRSYELSQGKCEWPEIIEHLELSINPKQLIEIYYNKKYFLSYDLAKIKDCLAWDIYQIDKKFWDKTKPLIKAKSKPDRIIVKSSKQKNHNDYGFKYKRAVWRRNPELEDEYFGIPGPINEQGFYRMIPPPVKERTYSK